MRLSAGRRCRAIRKEDWVSLSHWTLISMRHGAENRELDLIRKGDGFLFLIFVSSIRGLTPEPLQKLSDGKRSGSQGHQN